MRPAHQVSRFSRIHNEALDVSALRDDRLAVYVDRFGHRRLEVIAGPGLVVSDRLVQGSVDRCLLRNGKETRPIGIDPYTGDESSGQDDGSPHQEITAFGKER